MEPPAQPTLQRSSPGSVVFVDQYASVSGGQRSLVALIKVALAAGHEVSVMAPLGGALGELLGKTFGGTIALRDIPEARLTSDRKQWRDYAKYLAYTLRFLAQWRFLAEHEVIYVNGSRTFLPCHLIARALARRFIFHVRLDHKPAEKRLISMIAGSPRTFRVVSNSEYNTAQLQAFDGRLATCERLVTVENSLYPPYDSLPFRDRFAEGGRGLTFGIFGRVSPEKGHALIPPIAQQFPQSRFIFIGHCDPENRAFLDSVVAQCPGNCEYAGFRSDLPDAVEQYGIQVSLVPSLWNESFGLAAIESMAMSCLTAVSNVGMLPRLAARTGAFVFTQPADLLALCHRFHQMTAVELSGIVAAQHRATLDHFGFERFAREIRSLLAA